MQDFSSLLFWEKNHAGNSELRQYLHVSLGSAGELDYLLLLAKDLRLLTPCQYDTLEARVSEVKLMLARLTGKISMATQSPKAWPKLP